MAQLCPLSPWPPAWWLSAWLLKSSPATKQLSATKHTQNTQLLQRRGRCPHLQMGPHAHKLAHCTTHTAAGHSWCPYFGWRNVHLGVHMHTADTAVYHMCFLHADEELGNKMTERRRGNDQLRGRRITNTEGWRESMKNRDQKKLVTS